MPDPTWTTDVVVVGAGFAGLAAAGWLVLPCTADDVRFPNPFARRVIAALAARTS